MIRPVKRLRTQFLASQHNASLSVFATFYLLQFVALLFPRDGGFAALVYASPLFTTVALIVTGQARIRRLALVACIGIVVQSVALAFLDGALILNTILSFATYSSLYLLMLSPLPFTDANRISLWSKLLVGAGAIIALIGIAQLVAKGFPLRLPYIDYSPDVFEGPYGAGGHRLVPLIVGPALIMVISRISSGAQTLRRAASLILLLAIGLVVPGANAVLAAFVAATLLLLASVTFSRGHRVVRRGPAGTVQLSKARLWAMALVLAAVGTALFALTSLGSLPHITDSISRLGGADSPATSMPNPRLLGITDTLTTLPSKHPLQPVIGVGLGNYSSWSQLLLSGVYVDRFLKGRLSGIPVSYSETSWNLILWHMSPEAYDRFGRWYLESIATQPWFSWQSLYAEVGLLGIALLALAFSGFFGRLKLTHTDAPEVVAAKYTLTWYAWFAILAGFIDNFFEYPWLLVPFLLGLLALPKALANETQVN